MILILTTIFGFVIFGLYMYYYLFILGDVLRTHKQQMNVPVWFNKTMHMTEFKERFNDTIKNLKCLEGFITYYGLIVLKHTFSHVIGDKKILHYCTWSDLEHIIDSQINVVDIAKYDMVLGVDYGGALIAEYIKYKYKIKSIGYIRPRKKRSSYKSLFVLQLLFSYMEVINFLVNSKVCWLPYFTEMEWVQISEPTNDKKILIIDDGILSGGTVLACLNFMYNHYKFAACDMLVIHGLPRSYRCDNSDPNESNKLTVMQGYQLCYLPWGQT